MSDIRILPEIVSNRIAAGEVVERPVSVVKELVENSLDAKASRVIIEVKGGGRELIRVSDDGEGMTRDNALLAIERYATSKIFSNDDLFSIKSFGFRGEALPSIASVSRFTLVTRSRGSDSGTRIFINGGKVVDVSEIGAPFGTEISVEKLFFNTPARRKFLKSVNTEMGHIGDIFSGMALGNPGVGFRLIHNSRLIKSFSPSDSPLNDLLKRIGEVFGHDIVSQFCEISAVDHDILIKGYVSCPSLTRSSSRNIKLFVNKRMINDTGLISAIFRGFRGRIIKGRFPMAVLFIELPFDQVDVNVHPAKLQVRFANQNYLYSIVADAVHSALLNHEKQMPPIIHVKSDVVESREPDEHGSSEANDFSININDKQSTYGRSNEDKEDKIEPAFDGVKFERKNAAESFLQWGSMEKTAALTKEKEPDLRAALPSFHITGQVFGTYIVAESGGDMFLIDQHAAHERIVYEKLKKRSESFIPPSQSLMISEVLELGFREADILEKIIGDLSLLGIIIEPFGGTSFIIKSIPAIIDDKEIAPIIREIIDKILESGFDSGDDYHTRQWLDDLMIVMACHSAIRANYNLNIREMEKLLFDLEQCENPFNCPHGRPTRIKWSKREIEKLFKRIV